MKINVIGLGCECVIWIKLAKDDVHRWTLLLAVLKLHVMLSEIQAHSK